MNNNELKNPAFQKHIEILHSRLTSLPQMLEFAIPIVT